PSWRFDDATFDRTAASFDNPDFVDVVIHSYRVRYRHAPSDPRLDAIERRLAERPAITVPTVILHGAEDMVAGPRRTDQELSQFPTGSERRVVPRVDAVIVNGGLGPTVDDLSQEIAAQAAGVALALNEQWLTTMAEFFRKRSRVMPPNNKKQAMLPTTAEVIDNPIGTACGFALDIGRARFFFTPGVPRELRRMLEEQIIPRLLAKSGLQAAIHLKRFHSYGLGESHVDQLLTGVEELAADGSVKLGFRAHYPQLETKLTVRGKDMDDIRRKLAPVEIEVRKRMGNFIMAEDEQTL